MDMQANAMILIDDIGHMVSDSNEFELHLFARKLGLKREWFQTPGFGHHHAHYDLTTARARNRALALGAQRVDPFTLVKSAWWQKTDGFKALSMKQPWAWCIFHGKPVENRKWSHPYRGPLLIHASQNWDQEGYEWLAITFGGEFLMPSKSDYVFGAFIGQVTMVDCVETHLSPWFFGPYGFVFNDAKEYKKRIFPWSGRVRIFDVPGDFMEGGKQVWPVDMRPTHR